MYCRVIVPLSPCKHPCWILAAFSAYANSHAVCDVFRLPKLSKCCILRNPPAKNIWLFSGWIFDCVHQLVANFVSCLVRGTHVFTGVINQVRSSVIFSQTSRQSDFLLQPEELNASLKHFSFGFTFQKRRSMLPRTPKTYFCTWILTCQVCCVLYIVRIYLNGLYLGICTK